MLDYILSYSLSLFLSHTHTLSHSLSLSLFLSFLSLFLSLSLCVCVCRRSCLFNWRVLLQRKRRIHLWQKKDEFKPFKKWVSDATCNEGIFFKFLSIRYYLLFLFLWFLLFWLCKSNTLDFQSFLFFFVLRALLDSFLKLEIIFCRRGIRVLWSTTQISKRAITTSFFDFLFSKTHIFIIYLSQLN